MGKIMDVDLTTGKIQIREVADTVYDHFLSGMGLAAHILYREIPEDADPLGPDNVLGFVSGLLTGTGALFAGRWMITGKSPLTRGWGEANCGGSFSPAIKRCGVDGIFFRGTSPEPVYLLVDPSGPRLEPANDYWGRDTIETETDLLEKYPGAKVACIGPAGEHQSYMAGVSTDKGRMAARSGLGAVMGSKNLKALVLNGKQRIHPHSRERIKTLSKGCNKWVQFQPPFVPGFLTPLVGALMRIMPWAATQDGLLYKILLRKWGTVSMNQMSVEMGDSPIKNWKGSSADWGIMKNRTSNPDRYTAREERKFHCYSCPLGCGGICSLPDKTDPALKARARETHKPEYETVLSFGGFVMNTDTDLIFEINEIVNRAGMDTISAGNAVAFAMECWEKEIIKPAQTGGVALEWGSAEAIRFLVDAMVQGEGLGRILQNGVKAAAEELGNEAKAHAVHAGGQEMAMHDGRNDPGFALHYGVEPAPGRHTYGAGLYYEMYQLWKKIKGLPNPGLFHSKNSRYTDPADHAKKGKANSEFVNVINGSGLCLFGGFLGTERLPVFDWLNAATGRNLTPDQYLKIGTRIQTLKQAFNIKHGIRPMDNKPSPIAIGEPAQDKGANKGRTVDLEEMMKEYWDLFGWDRDTGIPTQDQITTVTRIS
ncbi:MAG: aldehyde ferredoxin oxidoreductase family protein [Desulfobacterales bacterium]|nr:aldehyde ferredoxin oxidoreductase family protein [Desulfobacterales bacterium]